MLAFDCSVLAISFACEKASFDKILLLVLGRPLVVFDEGSSAYVLSPPERRWAN